MLKKSLMYFGPIFLMHLNNRIRDCCFFLHCKCPTYIYSRVKKEKIEYNYLSAVLGQKISLVEVLFPFPREWEGPQNKFKPKENNNNKNKNTTEQVFCQDALTQTLCRQGTFSLCLNASVVRK